MPQLRWTLLCLGVLFVVLLAWIERRRQRRQGFSDTTHVGKEPAHGPSGPGAESMHGSMFREPVLTLPEMRAAREPAPPQDLPIVEIEDDSLNARRVEVGEPLMDPPTLSLPVVDSGPEMARRRGAEPPVADTHVGMGDSAELAFNEAVFGEPSLEAQDTPVDPEAEADEPHTRTDVIAESGPGLGAAPSEPVSRTQFLGGAVAPDSGGARIKPVEVAPVVDPIVDWPPDDQRRVVAIRLVANPPDRLAGRAMRLALASEGFVLGKFQIFHKPDDSGRAVLSAANLSKPGTFDLSTMDSQRYSGLSLFTVLPGPRAPLKAFEDLLATARNLNERLNGALQDERGGPLTPTRVASMRDSLDPETPS